MPWFLTDDGECDAPWVWDVGNEAYGVYARLGCYCAKHLTDGVVPWGVALSYAGGKKSLLVLEQLGRINLRGAERDKPTSVFLPYYLDANRTRSKVEADKETKRAAGRKGGLKSRRNGSVRYEA